MKLQSLIASVIATLVAASLSAQVTLPTTITTFTAATSPQVVNADNWDNGAPTGGAVGLININGSINASPTDYTVVQTGGDLAFGSSATAARHKIEVLITG